MNRSSKIRRKAASPKVKAVSRRIRSVVKADPLDRRILRIAAQRSFDAAAKETMVVMGYNVVARGGWVGNLYPDGRFEKISEIPKVPAIK